jgi:hypothetical protein
MFEKLTRVSDIVHYTKLFNRDIGYSNVPWKYHATGTTYAVRNEKGRIVGGFILIPGYWHLRAVLQMPEEKQVSFYEQNPKVVSKLCDLTGYFILSRKHSTKVTVLLLLVTLLSRYKYFIYTYPTHDKALEKYYGRGNPRRIHTGIPEKLEGHAEHMEEEHVEILTKYGIFKIFVERLRRVI